eukprot:802501-Alexandrium_andersonii.AAC.1
MCIRDSASSTRTARTCAFASPSRPTRCPSATSSTARSSSAGEGQPRLVLLSRPPVGLRSWALLVARATCF